MSVSRSNVFDIDADARFRRRDNSSQEIEMVDVLSPVSRKRTGRAYVALARSHSEK